MPRRLLILSLVAAVPLVAASWVTRKPSASSGITSSCGEVTTTLAGASNEMVRNSATAGAPLDFEPNCGQFDPSVRFVSRGRGYTLFLTDTAAVFALPKASAHGDTGERSVVRLTLEGASPQLPVGRDPLPGIVNYLIGPDPSHWHTRVPTYSRVSYDSVSPGVDLVYYSRDGVHEYDLVVAPGRDPSKVTMRADGAERMTLDVKGNLQLTTAAGTLVMRTPSVYQIVGGNRQPVTARYALASPDTIGFELGETRPDAAVVIDPQIAYGTFIGGSSDRTDQTLGVAVDGAGSAYVVSSTETTDFPTQGTQISRPDSLGNAVVTKFASDGRLVYSTYIGGSGYDGGSDIAVRADGVAYVLGDTTSSDFPIPSSGAFQRDNHGSGDLFLVELNLEGTAITKGTYLGGGDGETGFGLQLSSPETPVDPANVLGDRLIVFGATRSPNFPTVNSEYLARAGMRDSFVTIFERSTLQPIYSTYAGLGGDEQPTGLIADRTRGLLYLPIQIQNDEEESLKVVVVTPVAAASPSNIPPIPIPTPISSPTPEPGRPTQIGTWTLRQGKNSRAGAQWKVYWPTSTGTAKQSGRTPAQSLPAEGRPFLPVELERASFATAHTGCLPIAPATTCTERASLILWDQQLNYVSHVNFGGPRRGRSFEISGSALDADGRLHFIGTTSDDALPVQNPVQSTYGGSAEGFILTLDPTTGETSFVSYLGGSSFDTLMDIAVDNQGNRWIVGTTLSPNFPATRSGLQPEMRGRIDGFVIKIQP